MRLQEVTKRLFTRSNILTIPNALSLFRLCLVPLIVYLYRGEQNYPAAVAVIVLSGLTDVVDGWTARRFHMVSDVGKILDPLADKLTQAALIACLTGKYRWMWGLLALFAVKEVVQAAMGGITLAKYAEVNSAKWYGKASTATLYAVMIVLILAPDIPNAAAIFLGCACAAMLLTALVLYMSFYIKLFKARDAAKDDRRRPH